MIGELRFVEALRFIFSGGVIYAYWYYWDAEAAGHFASSAGSVGFPVILAVIGCVAYFTYRPLIYQPVLQPLVRLHAKSYVHTIEERLGEISRQDADRIYLLLRDEPTVAPLREKMEVDAAGIHMTCLAGIAAFPFVVIAAISGEWEEAAIYGCLAVALLSAGHANDLTFERRESDLVASVSDSELLGVARRIGIHPASDSPSLEAAVRPPEPT